MFHENVTIAISHILMIKADFPLLWIVFFPNPSTFLIIHSDIEHTN